MAATFAFSTPQHAQPEYLVSTAKHGIGLRGKRKKERAQVYFFLFFVQAKKTAKACLFVQIAVVDGDDR